ncbi:hypothetical protein GCM10022246_07710 [Pedobacter ginsengiterrae]|uniref:Uncharacterized protein n=1 Tax=Pedobacter ginsengiterrae TaxID=871696 RepID=A0ABP7NYM8_9SPHI
MPVEKLNGDEVVRLSWVEIDGAVRLIKDKKQATHNKQLKIINGA